MGKSLVSCFFLRHSVVALVLLYLSYTFCTADHSTLLSLLQTRFAVSDEPLAWLHSYLTNRIQTFTTPSSQTSRPHLCYSLLVSNKDLTLVQLTSSLTLKAPLTSLHIYFCITCMPITHRPMPLGSLCFVDMMLPTVKIHWWSTVVPVNGYSVNLTQILEYR